MSGSATFTMVVSRLTRNAASSSASRITGFDRMAEKLRRLVVDSGLKPPGVNRDAGGVTGPAQVDEIGQRQDQQHPGVRVARGEEPLAEVAERAAAGEEPQQRPAAVLDGDQRQQHDDREQA